MQTARIITGAAMAVFIGIGVVPGLRPYASRIRIWLLVLYLLAAGAFVAYVLLRQD
jgi:hypothetical protein